MEQATSSPVTRRGKRNSTRRKDGFAPISTTLHGQTLCPSIPEVQTVAIQRADHGQRALWSYCVTFSKLLRLFVRRDCTPPHSARIGSGSTERRLAIRSWLLAGRIFAITYLIKSMTLQTR